MCFLIFNHLNINSRPRSDLPLKIHYFIIRIHTRSFFNKQLLNSYPAKMILIGDQVGIESSIAVKVSGYTTSEFQGDVPKSQSVNFIPVESTLESMTPPSNSITHL